MNNPHDALFKLAFFDPAAVIAELRAGLPPAIVRAAGWSTLERLTESHVDAAFAAEHSDLVFALRLGSRDARLHLILEHKSTPDRWTAFQVAWYSMRLLRRFRREHPRARRLLPVIAVVIRHGAGRGRAPTGLVELLDIDAGLRPSLAPWLPNQRYLLDDLSQTSEADLRARTASAVDLLAILLLQRLGHTRDPLAELARLRTAFADARRVAGSGGMLIEWMVYAIRVLRLEEERARRVAIEMLGPEMEEVATSAYGQLLDRGRVEGRADTLLKQITAGFGQPSSELVARVRSATEAGLERWTLRILTAETADDVVAEDR